jgi:hypothetical protein
VVATAPAVVVVVPRGGGSDSIGENIGFDSNDTPCRLPWWGEARLETNVTESQK